MAKRLDAVQFHLPVITKCVRGDATVCMYRTTHRILSKNRTDSISPNERGNGIPLVGHKKSMIKSASAAIESTGCQGNDGVQSVA